MPLVSGVLIFLIVLSYQNCAQPLDEIGTGSNTSTGGGNGGSTGSTGGSGAITPNCQIAPSSNSVILGQPLTVQYSFAPVEKRIKVSVYNNTTDTFSETIYTEGGILNFTTTNSAAVGRYNIIGNVIDTNGAVLDVCYHDIDILPSSSSPNPTPPTPPAPEPTITLSTDKNICTGPCSVVLVQNVSNLAASGKAFRVFRIKSDGTEIGVSCLTTDGASAITVSFTYLSSPGINTLSAYLVPSCTSDITGVQPSASVEVDSQPRDIYDGALPL